MTAFKERLEIVGLVAEITAAAGVIISVIYLAVQVHGNTSALQTQTHFNAMAIEMELSLVSIDNPEWAAIWVRGQTDSSEFNEVEWARQDTFNIIQIDNWEFIYYLHRDGAMAPEIWEGWDRYYSGLALNNASWRRSWADSGGWYAEPFYSYANAYFFEEEMPAEAE